MVQTSKNRQQLSGYNSQKHLFAYASTKHVYLEISRNFQQKEQKCFKEHWKSWTNLRTEILLTNKGYFKHISKKIKKSKFKSSNCSYHKLFYLQIIKCNGISEWRTIRYRAIVLFIVRWFPNMIYFDYQLLNVFVNVFVIRPIKKFWTGRKKDLFVIILNFVLLFYLYD